MDLYQAVPQYSANIDAKSCFLAMIGNPDAAFTALQFSLATSAFFNALQEKCRSLAGMICQDTAGR